MTAETYRRAFVFGAQRHTGMIGKKDTGELAVLAIGGASSLILGWVLPGLVLKLLGLLVPASLAAAAVFAPYRPRDAAPARPVWREYRCGGQGCGHQQAQELEHEAGEYPPEDERRGAADGEDSQLSGVLLSDHAGVALSAEYERSAIGFGGHGVRLPSLRGSGFGVWADFGGVPAPYQGVVGSVAHNEPVGGTEVRVGGLGEDAAGVGGCVRLAAARTAATGVAAAAATGAALVAAAV